MGAIACGVVNAKARVREGVLTMLEMEKWGRHSGIGGRALVQQINMSKGISESQAVQVSHGQPFGSASDQEPVAFSTHRK